MIKQSSYFNVFLISLFFIYIVSIHFSFGLFPIFRLKFVILVAIFVPHVSLSYSSMLGMHCSMSAIVWSGEHFLLFIGSANCLPSDRIHLYSVGIFSSVLFSNQSSFKVNFFQCICFVALCSFDVSHYFFWSMFLFVYEWCVVVVI